MTTPLATPEAVRDAVSAAASAAVRTLPGNGPLTVKVVHSDPSGDVPLLPGGDGRAVSAAVRGAGVGSLSLLLGRELVTALENGPVGPQELLAAVEPTLADIRGALESFCSAPVFLEAGQEVAGEVAVAPPVGGQLFAAAPLHSDGTHVATLALTVAPVVAEEAPPVPRPRSTDEDPAAAAGVAESMPQTGASPGSGSRTQRPLELLHGVEMGVTAELGRTRMTVQDVLSLTPGAVVELDRAAGGPVDLLVNGTLIARGEVVVVDEEFGIRISEIVGTDTESGVRRPSAASPESTSGH